MEIISWVHKLDPHEQKTWIRPGLLILNVVYNYVSFADNLPLASSGPSDDALCDPCIPLSLVSVVTLCESTSFACSLDCSK